MSSLKNRTSPIFLGILILSFVLLAINAWMLVFARYEFHDDEGFILLALRAFAERGGLYGDVTYVYGPFHAIYTYGLYLLGIPLTHVGLRWVAWGMVVLMSGVFVIFIWWRTRDYIWTVLAVFVSFSANWAVLAHTPHPCVLMGFVISIMGVFGYSALNQKKVLRWAILCGTGASIMLLSKTNGGALAIFSMGMLWIQYNSISSFRRFSPWLLLLALVVTPLALVGSSISHAWVFTYVFIFIISGFSLAFAVQKKDIEGVLGFKALLYAAGCCLLVVVFTLLVLVFRGTKPWDIVEALLIMPRTLVVYQELPFGWPAQLQVFGVCSLVVFLAAYYLRRTGQPSIADVIVVFVRLLALLGVLTAFILTPNESIQRAIIPYIILPLWSFLWPLGTRKDALPMAWLCWLSVGQWLHAYPAAGDEHFQMSSMTALVVILFGGWETALWLKTFFGERINWSRSKTGSYAVLLLVSLVIGWHATKQGARAYLDDRQYFKMKSAETIKLSDWETILYRTLSLNIEYYADVLATFPNRMSYREWAGLETDPSAMIWMYAEDVYEKQKRHMVDQLESHLRPMVIIQDGSMRHFHVDRGLRYDDTLFAYVKKNFHQAYSLFGYSFHVKNGRPDPIPLFIGSLNESTASGTLRLVLTYKCKTEYPVASVEICEINRSRHPIHILNSQNSSFSAVSINKDGQREGEVMTGSFPIRRDGALLLEFNFLGSLTHYKGRTLMALLRDPNGEEIGMIYISN